MFILINEYQDARHLVQYTTTAVYIPVATTKKRELVLHVVCTHILSIYII